MRWESQRFRWLGLRLVSGDERRIVVITGARQTGKTTLARSRYPTLRYFSLDDLDVREQLAQVSARGWAASVGAAILDEAQKEPRVFEKLKYAYDEGAVDFSVLLGSSRILLLDRVRETLAGRSFLFELWPLLLSEILQPKEATPELPVIGHLLEEGASMEKVLGDIPEVLIGSPESERREALEHLATWGGMPELLRLDDRDRREWLRSYQQTFLERDLADLVRLADLEPFRALQKLCMLRSGKLLSYSELARDAGIGVSTARRYLEYLRISYQVALLQPFSRNLTSSVVKSPKLYWVDLGLLRQGTRQWGELTGDLFESLVVGELHKWVKTMSPDADLTFYRTRSGLEVDVLLATPAGIIGIEIKSRDRTSSADLRSLRLVAQALGREWLGGLVVYRGSRVACLDEGAAIWAMPAHRLF